MEELVFKLGNDSVSFRPGPSQVLVWPLPRRGDPVQVRGKQRSLEGVVDRISYYYSVGNNGPVVVVTLI